MGRSWLITGGCGFIGTSLIEELLRFESKPTVRILDNLSVGTENDLSEITEFRKIDEANSSPFGVELFVGDITKEEDCKEACKGIETVVHLAANTGVGPSVENPRLDMVANVVGTFNMLEAARVHGVSKFIFASSGAPIGELKSPPIHEELAPHPVSPYGASKLAGEGYLSAFHGSYGLNTIGLRFGNVYGPRSEKKASVVAKFIKLALAGKPCEIYGDGGQTRDFIYIADLVQAIIKSDQAEVGGELFQIATNKESTVLEVAQLLQTELLALGVEMEIVFGQERTGDVRRNFSDTSKAREVLNWQSTTSLDLGVRKTIEYFKEAN